jgi:5-methylcytosine-specific restriction endonuclease McrA
MFDMAEKICNYCNRTFKAKGTTQKHCSKGCYHKSITTKVTIICKGCGTEKQIIKSRANTTTGYCKACFTLYCKTIADTRKKPAHKRAEIGKKICKGCNTEFEYRINQKRPKYYCSDPCRRENMIMQLTPEQRDRGIKSRSKSEKWRDYVVSITGQNNKRYTGNRVGRKYNTALVQWRKAVFMRDNYTCQHCQEKGARLEAHHIKEYSKFPELRTELTNGITLCYDCHNKVHGKEKRIKTFACTVCGTRKSDGRRPMCRPCGAKNRKTNGERIAA